MAISMDEIQLKAAGAVLMLGHRAASKVRIELEAGKKPKANWIKDLSGDNSFINPDKFREAIAYYDIAASIDPDNSYYALYLKGLLLQEMGERTEYEKPQQMLAESHRPEYNAIADKALAVGLNVARGESSGTHEASKDEQMAATALQFVNLLLDKKYTKAKTMLHSNLVGMTAKDLKNSFEALFESEDFPESANVVDIYTDLPDNPNNDLASVYVAIDSENNEAVNVIVAREGDKLTIREIEWGRP